MAATRVQLLGPPRVLLGSRSVAFEADKRYQCLGYLAWKGDWVSRDELAFLFWPDVDTARSRHSLRQLVRRVRGLPWAPALEPERDRLRWRTRTDVGDLVRYLEERDYQSLLTAYRGDLLEGMASGDGGEFTSWLEQEREHLRTAWRRALFGHARELEAAVRLDRAVGVMEVLLARDPLDEDAVRALLRLGLRLRDRRGVMDAYGAFAERLRAELDLAPTAETQRLAEALRAAGPPAPRPRPSTAETGGTDRPSLPRALTSFVGREAELAEVTRLLARPECRLVTLTGFGGAGKTRLALRVAESLGQHYPDGVAFVDLTALERAEAVPAAIAGSLRLALEGRAEPLAELARSLGDGRLLVVLDAFEHVVVGAALVADLLEACPGLDLLVTSRVRLGLGAEWVLPLGGLSFPPDLDVGLADALVSDAVRLLVERARRMRPGFALSEADVADALRLCRLVDGSPLALEMAAVWLRALTLTEVVSEIGKDIDFLRDAEGSDRQRSLRAVFEHSWRLLGPAERRALRALSVFRGGFSREASAVVAGAPTAVLAALIDKSLVRMTPDGRYDLHPLVRRYALAKLAEAPGGTEEAECRHAEYYGRLLARLEAEAGSPSHATALRVFEKELENVRAAWRFFCRRPRHGELRRLTWLLRLLFDGTRRYREGAQLMELALDELGADEAHAPLVGTVQTNQAWLYYRMGMHRDAAALAESGLGKLAARRDRREARTGLNVLGAIASARGDHAAAKARWSEALSLSAGSPRARAAFLNNVALAEEGLGEYREAREHLEAALDLNRRLGDRARIANNLNALAELLLELGDARAAAETFDAALETAEEFDHRQALPHVLHGLGRAHDLLGHPRRAWRYSDRAVTLFRQGDERPALGLALSDRGRAAIGIGDLEAAGASIGEGLELAVAGESAPDMLAGLAAAAELHLALARPAEAVPLLGVVASHPNARRSDRELAQRLLSELGAGAPSGSGLDPAPDLRRRALEQSRRVRRLGAAAS